MTNDKSASLQKQKFISFSVYGDHPIYLQGAARNVELAHLVYPGWIPILYVSSLLPSTYTSYLSSRGAKVVVVDDDFSSERERFVSAMYWRLLALERPDASHVIFRDCDSSLGSKEAAAVDAWLQSGRDFHFMYDHPNHTEAIMGGMWGCRAGAVRNMYGELGNFLTVVPPESPYYLRHDQNFLYNLVIRAYVNESNYVAHGDPTVSRGLESKGIQLTPFPPYRPIEGEPRFIGEEIEVPGFPGKPAKPT